MNGSLPQDEQHSYLAYGFHFRSAIALPFAEGSPLATGTPTLRITQPQRISAPEPSTTAFSKRSHDGLMQADRCAEGLLLRYENAPSFLFSSHLSRCQPILTPTDTPTPTPTATELAQLELLLTSSVPSLWLTLRGKHVLHASAVSWRGKVIAFAGPSGSGKSSLAALCCDQGARLVTDDALVLEERQGCQFIALPGATKLRLRQPPTPDPHLDATQPSQLPGNAVQAPGQQAERSWDGRYTVPTEPQATPLPLHAVYLLGCAATDLGSAECLLHLEASHRSIGFTDAEIPARQFRQSMALLRTQRVHQLIVRSGLLLDHKAASSLVGELLHATNQR